MLLLVDGTDVTGSPGPMRWLAQRSDLRQVVLVGGTATVSPLLEATVSGLG